MSPTARARTWATCISAAVLLIGSLLPIWVAWHFSWWGNTWEGLGYKGPLWFAVVQLPSNLRIVGSVPRLLDLHEVNLVQGAILILVAGLAGFTSYRILSKRRVAM